jgi:hypothetical protein
LPNYQQILPATSQNTAYSIRNWPTLPIRDSIHKEQRSRYPDEIPGKQETQNLNCPVSSIAPETTSSTYRIPDRQPQSSFDSLTNSQETVLPEDSTYTQKVKNAPFPNEQMLKEHSQNTTVIWPATSSGSMPSYQHSTSQDYSEQSNTFSELENAQESIKPREATDTVMIVEEDSVWQDPNRPHAQARQRQESGVLRCLPNAKSAYTVDRRELTSVIGGIHSDIAEKANSPLEAKSFSRTASVEQHGPRHRVEYEQRATQTDHAPFGPRVAVDNMLHFVERQMILRRQLLDECLGAVDTMVDINEHVSLEDLAASYGRYWFRKLHEEWKRLR